MPKFLLLYRAETSAEDQMANASPEASQAGMDLWMTWAGKVGPALVEMGSPLTDAGSVGAAGSTAAGASGFLGGYSIMEADSRAALEPLLDDHPHLMLDGASIEVYEFLPLPGMP